MLKVKCVDCDKKYSRENSLTCPYCASNKGGFMQFPATQNIDGENYHLEEILRHKKTGNKFKIKEIQANGFICFFIYSPVNKPSAPFMKSYLSYSDLGEYSHD